MYVYFYVDITIEEPSSVEISAEERAMLEEENRDGESDTEGIYFWAFVYRYI